MQKKLFVCVDLIDSQKEELSLLGSEDLRRGRLE